MPYVLEEVYRPKNGKVRGWINSTAYTAPWSVNNNPIWGTPDNTWQAQWSGETHDPGDNLFGTPAKHFSFIDIWIKRERRGQMIRPIGNLSNNNNRYSIKWITQSESFDIWTTAP